MNNNYKEQETITPVIDFNNDFHILNTTINNDNEIDENYLTDEELFSKNKSTFCLPQHY